MHSRIQKSMPVLIVLSAISLLVGILSFRLTYTQQQLVPNTNKRFAWHPETSSDATTNGSSSIAIIETESRLSFKFTLSPQAQHRYATFHMLFKGEETPGLVNFSEFNRLDFNIKCAPANVIWVGLSLLEPGISNPGNPVSFRFPSTYVSCNEHWQKITLDLSHLETPEWWYKKFNIELSKQHYTLDNVARLSFGSSAQSPILTTAAVEINALTLKGENRRYLYGFGLLLLLLWGTCIFWFARQYTKTLIRDLASKLQQDRPLAAYQKLSIEPQREKEKNAILHFIASEYADPELNMDKTVMKVGISRTKINEILKEELGLTFSAHLNKLRLAEAARLLSKEGEANVADLSYSVGYRNVSYFNKLFKNEYGCTPRTFKNRCENNR